MPNNLFREALPGVWRIDVLHPAAGQTCCYLLAANGEGALIDCGAKNGVAVIQSAIAAANLRAENIKWIIPTHAHLDHAGATGELMQLCPNATMGAHASAVKHLTNPDEKLLPAVRGLYGDKFFAAQYEGFVASPKDRSRELQDGEIVSFGGRELQILHTPGHAWHHISVYDRAGEVFYAGDAFGVSFPEDNSGGELFIAPVMPPTQFHPDAAKKTVLRLRELNAAHAALAHFDIIPCTPSLADSQIAALNAWEEKADEIANGGGDFYMQFRAYLNEWYGDLARRHATDIHLTASGYAHLHNAKFPRSG